jgi:folate-binding protein YgfZ
MSGQEPSVLRALEGATFYSMPRSRISSQGTDFLITGVDPRKVLASLTDEYGKPLAQAEYDLARFAQGFVQFPDEVDDTVILTEVGLRDAVSFSKGCYVGQEVIERSDAIGKLPRTMERVVFTGGSEVSPDARVVSLAGQPLGKVVSVVADVSHSRSCAFCLLKTGAYGAGDRVQCSGVDGEILERGRVSV